MYFVPPVEERQSFLFSISFWISGEKEYMGFTFAPFARILREV